jgi:choice-of-anchor A domain-containing protein/uncharacterized repeat protein (TIGR01451 family)
VKSLTSRIVAAALAMAVVVLTAAGVAPAPPARAVASILVGPIDPVAAALGFGVFTEGNANVVTNENEGTMAVGGDLSFGNYQLANNTAGSFIVPGDAQPSALVVGGQINFAGSVGGSRLQVLSNGYVKVGNLTGAFVRNTDNNQASVNTRVLPANNYDATPNVQLVTQQPVPSVGPTAPINFAAAFATFRSTATDMATCANTVALRTPNGDLLPTPIPPGSNAVITLAPGVTNVLNIGATDLNNISILTFNSQPTATTPLLVNVDTSGVGNSFAWKAPNFAGIGGTQARYVLINFPTVTTLSLTPSAATVEGSIYAPNADLLDQSASNTEGSVITRTFDHQGGEIHYFPFSTTLSCGGGALASVSVVKSSTTTTITTVGQAVPYSYLVVNTGNVPLTAVTVTDVQTPPSSNANLSPIVCPVTTLAAGTSTTCTATYTVTQADLDNDALSNVATAHGTPPTGPVVDSTPDSLTIPATIAIPEISLLKSSTTTAITTVGQQVPYLFHVANTGGVTLTNVAVTDVQTPPSSNANLGPIVCPLTTLAPSASTTCTATYTVTQADLDNDGVTDTATAHGTPPAGPAIDSGPDSLTIPAAGLIPDIAVMKSSTTTVITTVGQQVPYSYFVQNTGGLTLTAVNVTDIQTPPSSNANLGPIVCPLTTLAPGASTTCVATYTVTQADLDHGSVSDTAVAHGTPPTGPVIDSPPDSLSVPANAAVPDIAVLKSSATLFITGVGQQVPYDFFVMNTGGVTLTNVAVTDVQTAPSSNLNLSPIVCPVTTLAPGASTTCTATYTTTQADLDNDGVADVASAHGTPPTGPVLDSPPDGLTIPATGLVAEVTVAKMSTTTAITTVGQAVPYQFLVANTGNVTLTNVTVTDVQTAPSLNVNLGPIVCPLTTLEPGQSTICTATYTVTQADLDNDGLSDTATAHGTPPAGPVVDSPPDGLTIPATGVVADISLVKSSTTLVITAAGQPVPYTFIVVNTGGLTLTAVTVNDTLIPPADVANLGPITCTPASTPNGQVTLAPGAATTCVATYTVSADDFASDTVENVATVTGTPPFGPAPVSPHSQVIIPVPHPAIDLAKSVIPTTITNAGDSVTYTFLVNNTGNTPLTNVDVQETSFSGTGTLGPVSCGAVSLAVGAGTTCTAGYTATQADINAGQLVNVAVAQGFSPVLDQPVSSAPRTAQVTVVPGVPAITIVKSSTIQSIDGAGQAIPYEYLVTNTGTVALTNVTVTDVVAPPASPANLGPITCGPTQLANGQVTLAPGASITCTATYTVSDADYAHGELRDAATAAGEPPTGPTVVSPESVLSIGVTPPLAVTGLATNPLSWAAVGLLSLLTGTALVVLTIRRRRTEPGWA